MKTFTSILLFTVLMIPALAQYDYHKQAFKVARQNQVSINQQLKSETPTIMLDSVISTKHPPILAGAFTKPFKKIYEYDSNNRLSMITEKAWHPGNKVFGITGKKMFFYNAEGLVDSISCNIYGLPNKNSYKYAYNTKGKFETVYHYAFVSGKWYLSEKLVYLYNDNGILSEIIYFDGGPDYFSQLGFFKFTYNDVGQLIEFKPVLSHNGSFCEQTLYEWNSNGNLISEVHKDFVYDTKDKAEYFYDNDGDKVKSKYYTDINSAWVLSSSSKEYTYIDLKYADLINNQIPGLNMNNPNEFGSLAFVTDISNAAFFEPIELKVNKLISEVAFYNGSTLTEMTKYYYSDITKGGTTGVNKLNIADIKVYPNPATDKITFTWNQNYDRLNLKLFQVTGACVLDREISAQENVSVKNLQNGMYLYKLTIGNQTIKSGKLVKK